MHKEEEIQSVKLNRSSIQIKENEYVEYKGEVYKISSIIDFNEVVGIDIKTKRAKRLRISDIKPILNDKDIKLPIFNDIGEYTDSEFQEIQKNI